MAEPAPDNAHTALADTLSDLARQLDDLVAQPSRMETRGFAALRNAANPPFVHMLPFDAAHAIEEGWYISQTALIERLDRLDITELTLLDGRVITREVGQPFKNPDAPTGLTGPGILGAFNQNGAPSPENRAVDIIPYFLDAKGCLAFYGIARGAKDGFKAAFNGGFNEGRAFHAAVKEFIEESVSASALSRMQQDDDGQRLIAAWKKINAGDPTTAGERATLIACHVGLGLDIDEVAYHWLSHRHPQFIVDMTAFFARHQIQAYRGPARADPRNTDTRWIATEAFACEIPQHELTAILSRYDLALKGGSDASAVNIYGFDTAFVLNAYASHGPILMHAFAEILRTRADLPETVYAQARELIDAVARHLGQNAEPETARAVNSAAVSAAAPR